MKIIVFDKYLGYQVGGAQNSLHTLLKELKGDSKFLGCDVKKAFSAEKYKLPEWEVERMKIKEFPRFPYFEYWLNRKKVGEFIKNQKADLLITQGLYGALAVRAFNGKSIYFIRDEYGLNHISVTQTGVKKFFKKIYLFLQWPFVACIFRDNKAAISKADIVVSNSKFIAEGIKNQFDRGGEIVYPLINVAGIVDRDKGVDHNGQFITVIGYEDIKGGRIVENIAKIMPDHQFMIVGRNFNQPIKRGNILYQPWSKNVEEIYGMTKILLAPSLWDEAFCRVAVEGTALGIPCIGSNKGGIPEVLNKNFIIDDVWNIDLWKNKIKEIEDNYDECRVSLKKQVLKFNAEDQIKKFKEIVKGKLNLDL
jgi:glycosyltransferase involved in cell wall biosynthesis